MKYFISSLGFRSKNVTSILNRNILLLKKNMYSVQLCVVNLWLYLSVCFCHVYVYEIQLCVVNLSLYVVCMLCQVNMYSMQLCAVNFWFYVVWGIVSRLYLFYTAVWCQSLIAFCLCGFIMSICIAFNTTVCFQHVYACFC